MPCPPWWTGYIPDSGQMALLSILDSRTPSWAFTPPSTLAGLGAACTMPFSTRAKSGYMLISPYEVSQIRVLLTYLAWLQTAVPLVTVPARVALAGFKHPALTASCLFLVPASFARRSRMFPYTSQDPGGIKPRDLGFPGLRRWPYPGAPLQNVLNELNRRSR